MTLSEHPLRTRSGPPPRPDSPRPVSDRLRGAGPQATAYVRVGKRALGLLLLVLVLPAALALGLPIALVNLAIFRDPRRILFRQARVGRDGVVFGIWKFRTMREGREGREEREGREHFESWRAGTDRLRVTRFGRLLRNTHLDELPQIVNVLRGEMSFVGPRPEMVDIHRWATEHIPGFEARCAVRPGITGLAQVTQGYAGMDEAAYRAKLEADLRYIRSTSLALDLRILFSTVLWMLEGKGWRRGTPVPPARGAEEPLPAATMTPWPRPASSPAPPTPATRPARGTPSVRTD